MSDQLTQWARSLFKEISEPGNGRAGETPVAAPRQAVVTGGKSIPHGGYVK